jgi:hypothetical protein
MRSAKAGHYPELPVYPHHLLFFGLSCRILTSSYVSEKIPWRKNMLKIPSMILGVAIVFLAAWKLRRRMICPP